MVSSAIWKKYARVSFSKTIKMTSVCFFELHEKPYYYLLIIYMKKFRVNYIFICSQSSAIGMRNFKPHINYSSIFIPQRVYSVVIANTKVRETDACYIYT